MVLVQKTVVDQHHDNCFALSGSRFAPVCAADEASRLFLTGAATPPRPRRGVVPHSTFRSVTVLAYLLCLMTGAVHAQSVRDRTRPKPNPATAVNESQAADLTLTLTAAAVRPLQTWVRTGATIDKTGRVLTAEIRSTEAELVKVGQRVRAFPPDAKSSMYQAKVTAIRRQGKNVAVDATLPAVGRENTTYYVMEIVVDRGEFLTIPNEAIIEEGDKRVVYLQESGGQYTPREIHTGVQGELYTHVLHGLVEGDQVVTFGSFFIDSEHKLKATGQPAASNGHHHH